jgi:ribosomal 50S subunit-recycling heat shock protein
MGVCMEPEIWLHFLFQKLFFEKRNEGMRLDKYLKVSRLIKRRTIANEACDAGRVMINDKPAKASSTVKVGDVIAISFGNKEVKVEVLDVTETVRKEEAKELFKYLS